MLSKVHNHHDHHHQDCHNRDHHPRHKNLRSLDDDAPPQWKVSECFPLNLLPAPHTTQAPVRFWSRSVHDDNDDDDDDDDDNDEYDGSE